MKNCVIYVVVLLAVASSAHYIGITEKILNRRQRNLDFLNWNDLYRVSTGTLYSFHSECRNYEDAKLICKQSGGHLAVVNSDGEADLLAAIFQRYPPESLQCESELYLGVHYVEVGLHSGIGTFVTFQGDTLEEAGYAKWADGEPNNLTSHISADEECVTFYRNKRLNDLNCGHLRPFVCEIPGYVYKRESNSRYKLHLNSYKPARAARVCRSHGGHLASVDTEAEALMIKQAMSTIYQKYASLYNRKNPYFHVDFHLERSEPEFSTELDVTNNLEPTYVTNNCVAIDAQGRAVGVSCEQENFFLCEIDNDDFETFQNLNILV